MLPASPSWSEIVLSPASMLIYVWSVYVRIYIGVHPLRAAFDDSTATYITATMIPPFRLLQADYPSTILGIQYTNSTVIISRDPTDAFDDSDWADALKQIRRYPLRIPQKFFDDSADDLWITHKVNPRILWSFLWHVPYTPTILS